MARPPVELELRMGGGALEQPRRRQRIDRRDAGPDGLRPGEQVLGQVTLERADLEQGSGARGVQAVDDQLANVVERVTPGRGLDEARCVVAQVITAANLQRRER